VAAVAVQAEGLSKLYRIGQFRDAYGTLRDSLAAGAHRLVSRAEREREEEEREIWALRDVSFTLTEGEVLGIIGRNGAGKSTLLKLLTRITAPTEGHAVLRGRVGSLLEVGTGFHPELTGRENIYLNGSILGMKRREITSKYKDILEFSGVEKFIDTPVKRYSSGMYVRLAFAVAAHLEPEILLVDEVLAVGDFEFQRRCLGRMEDFSDSGRTVVFVSHQLQTIARLCERVMLLDGGQIVRDGPATEVVAHYLQTEAGSSSVREWPGGTGPGTEYVRARSVRAINEDGSPASFVDIRQPVGIEICFRVFPFDRTIVPKIKVIDQQGEVAFNAMDTSPRWHEPVPPGDYTATAWIPGNLLNEGLMSVEASVVTLVAPKVIPHFSVHDAVSFHVTDPGVGDSARGNFSGHWSGAVRPLLDWSVEER
jgi:homopolymeric O-antigen transport system ATP-binding protein